MFTHEERVILVDLVTDEISKKVGSFTASPEVSDLWAIISKLEEMDWRGLD